MRPLGLEPVPRNNWGFLMFSRYSLTLPPKKLLIFFFSLNKFWTCVLEKSLFCAHSGGIFVGKITNGLLFKKQNQQEKPHTQK